VGCFASGASPYGVEELCGTVWEWSNDDHEGWTKVLRGGWFYQDTPSLSARSPYNPYGRNYVVGFRCVVVPSSR
jgi:formylglycine-generating enzyme required for sulfatase activity